MRDPCQEGRDFAEFLRKLSPEQIAEGNRRELERAEADHHAFATAFQAGHCYICGRPLSHYDKRQPCLHWLLRPAGFIKSDFPLVTKLYGFFQIQAYLRWVANEEARAQNINDLAAEGTGKLIEMTIRYKDYEWSFSCGQSDMDGHPTASPASQMPHYHFQMRVNKASFIKYNDFHVPFSDMDLINLTALREAPDLIKQRTFGGEGMTDLLSEGTLEAVVRHGKAAPNEETAPIKLDTIIEAEEGTSISGDDLYALIKEAKENGVTLASMVHKLKNVRATTIVTPGQGVVEQAPRKGGRGKKA